MRLITLLIVLTFATNLVSAQTQISNFKTQFKLPEKVKETSGLLFLNGKIITYNDSGNEPNLYEINSLSGDLLRTISVSNATNIDWEDLAEDETHLYIADIGNNNGNRKDLKIYKVLKTDFKNNAAVEAKVISYSYEDQTSYTTQTNASNFDAEGIVVYHNNLLIFTKNWTNLKTNVYKIPTLSGSYVASKISSANVAGLITGAVFNQDRFFLTGYTNVLKPFLIYISPNRKPGEDIFFSGFTKIQLEDELSQGRQIEGITNIDITGKYYISREAFITTISDTSFSFPQNLYQFLSSPEIWLQVKIELS